MKKSSVAKFLFCAALPLCHLSATIPQDMAAAESTAKAPFPAESDDAVSSGDTYAEEVEEELIGEEIPETIDAPSSSEASSKTEAPAKKGEAPANLPREIAEPISTEGTPGVTETEFVPKEPAEPDSKIERKDVGLPGIEHELTQKYIKMYLGTAGKKILIQSLKNSVPYRPYIIQQLEANGLPLYLQYLPIVESNYVTTAVSRSGATGIWQFMENSMKPLLKKSAWFDDRLDPWKSTDAAILKLKENYARFNDWALALAAYNCGAGAMSKVVKDHPGKDFWYLAENGYLKQQSAQYVPKLLAIADIVENAEYHGATDILEAANLIEGKEVEEFDYVSTVGMLSFQQIADVTGLPKDTVKTLNQALFRRCTPAGEVYKLRLPKGYAEGTEEKLKKQGIATDAIIYTVKQGDSLWAISRKYGITVQDLCLVNGINEKSILSIGKKLIVPIFK